MAGDGSRTALITGGFTLGGAVIGIVGTLVQADLSHNDQSESTRASHIQAFSEAMRESIPILTKPNNDQAIIICLSSLVELSQAGDPRDKELQLEEEIQVFNVAGSVKSRPVQAYLFGFLNGIPNGETILASDAPEEYYELVNFQDQKLASSKLRQSYVDATPAPVAGIQARYPVAASTIGWIYLGRGDFTSPSRIDRLIQPSSVLGDAVPAVGQSVTLSRDVHLRDARPTADKRLGRIIGVLKSGQRVELLDTQDYEYGGSQIIGEAWAKVQVVAH